MTDQSARTDSDGRTGADPPSADASTEDRPADSTGETEAAVGGEPTTDRDAQTRARSSSTRATVEEGASEGGVSADDEAVLLSTTPTIKPVAVWAGIAAAVGLLTAGGLLAAPIWFDAPAVLGIGALVVGIATGLVLVRLFVRMYVLLRTRYVVTESTIQSEFELFYVRKVRELPFDRVRGFDVEQDRIQSLLGVGTVSTLSGGTNHSLGFVEFEHVPEPERIRAILRDRIDEH